jgi:hypothetical protein
MAHESSLSVGRGRDGGCRVRERDEEAVALCVHLDAAVTHESLADELAVRCEDGRVTVSELVEQARRVLDVGKEKSDAAGWQLGHGPHRSIRRCRVLSS